MFCKQALTAIGGYNTSASLSQCEDYELFIRLHASGRRGYNLQQPLIRYYESALSYKKRTYARRIREARVRWNGFKQLDILNRGTLHYVIKPLIIGAVPAPVHHYIRRKLKKGSRVNHV